MGEGPEHGRHMGADRLAFRTRRAFAGAAVELRAHGRVLDLGGVDVTDPWLRHRCFSAFSCASKPEAETLYSPCLACSFACCRMATMRSTAPARAWSTARLHAAQARRAACAWRGILNHRHLAWRHRFVGMAAASRVFASGARSDAWPPGEHANGSEDRKSTRLNSSHSSISYAVFCLKKKKISFYIFSLLLNNVRNPTRMS